MCRKLSKQERTRRSEGAKRSWQNLAIRRRRIAAGKRALSDPTVFATKSKVQALSWKNPEIRKRRGKGISKAFADPVVKAKLSASLRKAWQGPNRKKRLKHLAKVRKDWHSRYEPNKGELVLQKILDTSFPGEFSINVKVRETFGGKIPDFVHTRLPVVVELFGNNGHDSADAGKRKRYFAKRGYRVVIVWAKELRRGKLTGSIKRKVSLAKTWSER